MSFFPSNLLSSLTQIRGHMTGSSPPSPPRFVRYILIARRLPLFLPSSTRVELCLTHAKRSQQLILFTFFKNNFKISPRRDSNSRTNTIRGLLLLLLHHRGDTTHTREAAHIQWLTLVRTLIPQSECRNVCTYQVYIMN